MNYFNIYLEGLALMYARQRVGMVANEGLLYPIHETAVEIVPAVPLEDSIFVFNTH